VLRGQNHGLFLDMAEGRRWVRDHAAARSTDRYGLKVLNLFAYTCAFSVGALQAGARHVVNVDMSHGAIGVGQQNHQLNGITTGAAFLPHDIFSSWGKITRGGPYGLVIVDPPSYQKGSFVATKDYARLMRRLPDLLAPGGHALLYCTLSNGWPTRLCLRMWTPSAPSRCWCTPPRTFEQGLRTCAKSFWSCTSVLPGWAARRSACQ